MNATEQVQYESGLRIRYGLLFLVAALLVVGGQLVQLVGPQAANSEVTVQLLAIHKRVATDLIGSVMLGLGFLCIAGGMTWIHQITRARNPTMQDFMRWLLLVGAVITAITAVANEILLANAASKFVKMPLLSYPEAHSALSGPGLGLLQVLGELGSILLPVGLIWIALNAMRVGLLPKYVAYLGVATGVVLIVPAFGPIGLVIQAGWLGTMAMLVGGRMPAGDPPAWTQGISIPWPASPRAAAAQRNRAARAGAAPASARRPQQKQAADVVEGVAVDDAGARTRASTPKRKRKKR